MTRIVNIRDVFDKLVVASSDDLEFFRADTTGTGRQGGDDIDNNVPPRVNTNTADDDEHDIDGAGYPGGQPDEPPFINTVLLSVSEPYGSSTPVNPAMLEVYKGANLVVTVSSTTGFGTNTAVLSSNNNFPFRITDIIEDQDENGKNITRYLVRVDAEYTGDYTLNIDALSTIGSLRSTRSKQIYLRVHEREVVPPPPPLPPTDYQFTVKVNMAGNVQAINSNLVQIIDGTKVDYLNGTSNTLLSDRRSSPQILVQPVLSNSFAILERVVLNGEELVELEDIQIVMNRNTRLDLYYGKVIPVPTLDVDITPVVNVRDGQVPPVVPIIGINFSKTDTIKIRGAGFNNDLPLELTVAYSRDIWRYNKWLSFDLWGKSFGTKTLIVEASNLDGGTVSRTVTVQFNQVDSPPEQPGERKFITSVFSNRTYGYEGQKMLVSYSIRHVEELVTDTGIKQVNVGVEDESGNIIILDSGAPTRKNREFTVPNLALGTYKVFVEVEGQYFPTGNDTRLYVNTLLTIRPVPSGGTGGGVEPLTIDDLYNNILTSICTQIQLDKSYNDFINDTRVLSNLLVRPDGSTEDLILAHTADVDGSVILKMYEELDPNFNERNQFFIVNERVDSIVIPFDFSAIDDDDPIPPVGNVSYLRGPNWDIDDPTDVGLPIDNINLIDITSTSDTGYLRLDDITAYDGNGTTYVISGSIATDILNSIESKLSDVELDLDYTDLSKFIFYSSAKQRLTNFKSKLELIETYQKTLNNIKSGGAVTGSLEISVELNDIEGKINDIKNGFDGYENFLFTSTDNSAWPKENGVVYHTSASQALSYYISQSGVAEIYDRENPYFILKDLPEYIIRDDSNAPFTLFVTMIGHHFDLLKAHVDSLYRAYVRTHDVQEGTPSKLVRPILEAFGWQIRTSTAQTELSEYILGKHRNGAFSSRTTSKNREEALLRRFLNNLPYILKTKGTRASIRALFSIYGIPESIIQIREFGGPKTLTNKSTYFQFEDPTAVLTLSGSQNVSVDWIDSDLTRKPDTIEVSFSSTTVPSFSDPAISGSYLLLSTGDYINVWVDSVPSSSYNGSIRVAISGSTGVNIMSSSALPIFDGDEYTMMLRRTDGTPTDTIDLFVKNALYASITHVASASMFVSTSYWDSGSTITLGNGFEGKVDEFRLWKVPLSEASFNHHVVWKESIRGDNYTSSVSDLLVRLPFEQPQDLATSNTLINYAFTSSNGYGVADATANNFTTVAESPYQFEWVEHPSAFEAPSIAYKYYNDKIRFETQTLLDGYQLNPHTRVTKKSFDESPVDSNRLGVFFAPTDEINRDIVRAFTGYDFMNEIGDPEAYFSSSYDELDDINKYYWQRHNAGMNIYEYITVIRQLDKSVFEYIRDVAPVRSRIHKGLLFEPHLLERNRVNHRKPSKENRFWDGTALASQTGSQAGESRAWEGTENVKLDIVEEASYQSLSDTIDTTENILQAGSYLTYDANVDELLTSSSVSGSWLYYDSDLPIIQGTDSKKTESDLRTQDQAVIGFYEDFLFPSDLGIPQTVFGIYAIAGETEIIFLKDGQEKRRRYKLELIDKSVSKKVSQLIDGATDGQAGEYQDVVVSDTIKQLNVLNITGSFTVGSSPLNGYLPFHRTRTTDLTTGLQNSYYNGSVQTEATTIDGGPPVEISISAAGVLRVNKTDRDSDEPILEVE